MNRLRQFAADIAAAFCRLFVRAPKWTPAPLPHRPKTIIIAYNHDSAREYARDNRLLPQDWAYVTEPEHLYGYHNVHVVRLAGWKNRKDTEFLQALVRLEAMNGGRA